MIECVCLDNPESPDMSFSQIRMARKEYKCCECGAIIKPGDKYKNIRMLFKGYINFKGNYIRDDWYGNCVCIICHRIARDFFPCGYCVDGLYEIFEENFGYFPDDDFTDEEDSK